MLNQQLSRQCSETCGLHRSADNVLEQWACRYPILEMSVASMVTSRFAYTAFCLLWLSSFNTMAAEQDFRALLPGGDFPHPAVLFVPGCSGFTAKNGVNYFDERATELQAAGYVVVFVDYLARRRQTNCAYISLAEVAKDISEAVAWARGQPKIDAGRISVIGWSYGGGGVLAALKVMLADPPIAKAVMYYPVCRGASPWSTAVTGLMMLGGKDDVAFPTLCETVVKGVQPNRLQVVTYPEARHGFDVRGAPEHLNGSSGASAYNAEAAQASWSTVREFLK